MSTLALLANSFDLAGLFALACLLGIVLCGCAMGMIPHGSKAPLHWVQRGSYLAIALVLVWSFLYADETGWQPWPPNFGLVVVIDCIMLARIVLRRTDFLESKI